MQAIYKIQNLITGDLYVGSAIRHDYRMWVHKCRLRKKTHHSQILQNAWNKYGEEAFAFIILEAVNDKHQLIIREQYYIDTLNPRYNISKKAGSPLGTKHTFESRTNMSLAQKGRSLKERGHRDDCGCCICSRPVGEKSYRYKPRETRPCACGCGGSFACMTDSSRKYKNGHNKPQLGRKRSAEAIIKHRKSLLKYYENRKKISSSGGLGVG